MNEHKHNQCFIEMEWSQKFNIERSESTEFPKSAARARPNGGSLEINEKCLFCSRTSDFSEIFTITVLQLFHRFIAVHCISFLWISFCAVPCSCSSLRHRRANCALHSVVAGSRRHRSRALQGVRRPEVDHE